MTDILGILDELAATDSRNAKLAILQREERNASLIFVIKDALNPYLNFYIKSGIQIPAEHTGEYGIGQALVKLKDISSRKVTGDAARALLCDILRKCSARDAEVIKRVVERDLRCGVNEATVNKVWPAIVPTFDVMLADTDKSKIVFPAYAQTKMDGVRCHLHWDGQGAQAFSRNGKPILHCGKLNDAARGLMNVGETWDGELVCVDEHGRFLDRKTSNGIINKAIRGTIGEEEAERITFTVWDIVDFQQKLDYDDRFEALHNAFMRAPRHCKFRIIDNRVVNSLREAEEVYREAVARGEEGIILKNICAKWQPKRTKDLCKFKAEEEADLRVVGWERGTGRNANRLGNLILETEDALLRVSVGTGFSDVQREEYTEEVTRRRIVTVKYNMKIQNDRGEWSLFLPRFVEIREDKDTANTLAEIV